MKGLATRMAVVITFVVCAVLSLRVGILLLPALPSLVVVPVLYSVLRHRWQPAPLLNGQQTLVSAFLRPVALFGAFVAYGVAWFQPVLTGAGPDSGSSFDPFFKSAAYYLHICGYKGWFINHRLAPGRMFSTFSMVAAWTLPAIVLLSTILLHFRRRSVSAERSYLIAALFSFLMPLWSWGPAGALHALAGGLAFASVSRLHKQEMENAPTTGPTVPPETGAPGVQ